MASKQATPVHLSANKISRKYYVTALLMVALIFGAWALQHEISVNNNALLEVEATAGQQTAYVETIAVLVEAHQAIDDDSLLISLGRACGDALANYEDLAPAILSNLERDHGNEAERRRAYKLDVQMRGFIKTADEYASGVNSDVDIQPLRRTGIATEVDSLSWNIHLAVNQVVHDACLKAKGICENLRDHGHHAQDAAVIARLAEYLPAQWNSAVNDFITVKQKEADTLASFSAAVYLAMLGLLAYAFDAVIRPAVAEIIGLTDHLEQMGSTDVLTGLYNSAMFFRVVTILISDARRKKHKLTALAVDIDEIKTINDTHGRAAGDAAIRVVARALNDTLRGSDVMGRVGGGEFGVFLPSTEEYGASLLAERLRAAVEQRPLSVNNAQIHLAVSIGLGEMREHHKTPDDVFRDAEAALRRAKAKGRNCVVVYSAATAAPVATPSPV